MSVRTIVIAALVLAPLGAVAAPARTVRLEALFQQKFAEIACPAGTPADRFCLRATGEGYVLGIGFARFSRTVVIGGDFADGCVPASTFGTLTHRSDTLSFAGAGSYCVVAGTAAYAFTVTGGTGALAGLTGNGTITVPPAATESTGTEIWTGLAAQ
jgi:hypothetical protein